MFWMNLLSPEAYSDYCKKGYVSIEQDFLDPVDFNNIRALAYDVVQRQTPEMGSNCIPQVQDLQPQLLNWLLHPSFIKLAQSMLGPDLAFCTSTIYFKKAQSEQLLTFHRDYHIIPKSAPEARNKVINIVFALDPAPIESGCLQYVPGSHLEEIGFSSEAVQNSMIRTGVIKTELHGEKLIYMPLRSNQVAAHNALIVHGSGPNESTSNRCLLSIRFFSTSDSESLKLYLLTCKGAQLVSGIDKSGKNLPVSQFYLKE